MNRSLNGQTAYTVYPAESYTFGVKDAKGEKDNSAEGRMARLKAKYEREGMRRSVEAVLLVAEHQHPHVLMLQLGQSSYYRLPGGRLRPGEDEVSGLKRKLTSQLQPETELLQQAWEVGECVATWVRPNFDTVFYPYNPPHITKPKEVRKLFIVPLPERGFFGVSRNHRLVAVPLFELYDNFSRYGPIVAALPQTLSRFRFTLIGGSSKAAAAAPAGGSAAPGGGQQQIGEEYDGVMMKYDT